MSFTVPIITGAGFVGGTSTPIAPVVLDPSVRQDTPFTARAVINGMILQVASYTVTLNAQGVVDSAEFVVPMQGNPDFTVTLFQGETDTSAIPCTLYAGYPSIPSPSGPALLAQLTKRFTGQLDQYTMDHEAGTVTFDLRSLGAGLADRRLTTPISYATSLDLITAQAAEQGLSVKAALVGSPVPMSEVFSRQFVAGIKNFRVWDLIVSCSMYDDTDVWVDGSTLYYMAPSLIERTTVPLKLGRDLKQLSVTHAQQYNRKIRVEVRTYNPRVRSAALTRVETRANGTVVVKQISRYSSSSPVFGTTGVISTTYETNGTTSSSSSGSSSSVGGGFTASSSPTAVSGLERYIIYKAGLTPAAANALARSTWRRISMHEWAVTAGFPVRQDMLASISRTALISLFGSPYSAVNQTYWPRRITETAHLGGVTWTVEAVNHQLPLGQV